MNSDIKSLTVGLGERSEIQRQTDALNRQADLQEKALTLAEQAVSKSRTASLVAWVSVAVATLSALGTVGTWLFPRH